MKSSKVEDDDNFKEFERKCYEASVFRAMAFSAVLFATISTLVSALSIPMFYTYIYQLQTDMREDINFCKSRSSNIWKEIGRTQVNSLKGLKQICYGKNKAWKDRAEGVWTAERAETDWAGVIFFWYVVWTVNQNIIYSL